MRFCVIIPSKNAANLIPCLTALRKHEPDCPIVVVDDGIGQQGIDQAVFCEPIEFISGIKPFIFARNINAGIRHCETRWALWKPDGLVLLNDDAMLESPGGFALLEQAAKDNPHVGIIGATTDLTGQPLQRRRDIGLREVEHIAFVCVYIPRRTIERLRDSVVVDIEAGKNDYLTGGLLDERYVNYGSDDLDYCMQVRHAGLGVYVHDGCYINHSSLHSSFRGAPETAGDIWPNHRLLRAKWDMPPNPLDPQQRGAK